MGKNSKTPPATLDIFPKPPLGVALKLELTKLPANARAQALDVAFALEEIL